VDITRHATFGSNWFSGGFPPNISGTINPMNKLLEDQVQTTKGTFVGGPPLPQSKYNMASGRHLENQYDVIFQQWMFRFGQNSAARYRI